MVLSNYVSVPIEYHINSSGFFCFAFPFTMLFNAVLAVTTGVGGCGWPIYAREVLVDVLFRQFTTNPPNSIYVADAMTFIIILHYTCTGPFLVALLLLMCYYCIWDLG